MSAVKSQLIQTIEYLPESEIALLLEIARRFVPDDVATADDLEAIRIAHEEYAKGETLSSDEIDWG